MSQGAHKERLRPFKPLRFGRYTLLRPLSTGGMGELFLARLEGAQGFEKLCVIKKILPHLAKDTDFVARFVDEGRILVKLSHGNVAQVLDMGLHDGAPYIALEFVDGKDLRRVAARAKEQGLEVPLAFSLYVVTRLLDALAYAHRKKGDDGKELNLVHRDISPQNILISYEGEVKVIDFGLAKSALSAARTHPSIVLGKFLYMSPEQARHQKVDRRSDLYAVGLCLYELIAGTNPFERVEPGELMAVVAKPDIAPLQRVAPGCPAALSEVVMKALAVDPAQRFQTAEELRARLLGFLHELDPSAGPETAARFMAEAFADEHQAERKMLTELQAQARALHEDTEGDEAPRAPAKSTLEVPASKAAQTRDEVPVPPEPSPEALSFQPTRKSAVTAKSQPLQPVMAPEGRATLEAEPAAVVVDDALAGLARAAPDARVTKAPPKPKPAGRNSSIRPLPPVKSGSNHNLPPVQRATPPEADVSRARAPAKAAAPSETLDQAPPAEAVTSPGTARKAGGVWVWVALPLFAIAAVATYIAWDLQTQALPPRQDAVAPTEAEPAEAPRSREVKVPGAEVAPAPEAELDELAAPGKLTKKKLAPAPRAISKPAMLSKVRVLVDDVPAARGKLKLTMRLSELEKQAGQPGNEAEFTSQVRALEADAKAALEGP